MLALPGQLKMIVLGKSPSDSSHGQNQLHHPLNCSHNISIFVNQDKWKKMGGDLHEKGTGKFKNFRTPFH